MQDIWVYMSVTLGKQLGQPQEPQKKDEIIEQVKCEDRWTTGRVPGPEQCWPSVHMAFLTVLLPWDVGTDLPPQPGRPGLLR